MPTDDMTRRVYALIDPIVTEEGCDLLDVEEVTEHAQRVLRVTIDRPGGATIAHCSLVSQAIEDLIEVEGIVHGRYHLEVSTPGPSRPMTKPRHYQSALAGSVEIQTRDKIDGQWRFKGVLESFDGTDAVIKMSDELQRVPLALVKKARQIVPIGGL